MQFVRNKNLTEREVILYIPVFHWMFVIKHLLVSNLIIFGSFSTWFVLSGIEDFAKIIKNILFLNFATHSKVFLFFWFVLFLSQLTYYILYYCSKEYGVTNKRLMIKEGILKTVTEEIPLNKIESIDCRQSLIGFLFNYGDVTLNGVGGSKKMKFYMVQKPHAFRRKVVEILEKDKIITVIHGNIPKYVRPEKPKPKPIDDTYLWGNFVKVS